MTERTLIGQLIGAIREVWFEGSALAPSGPVAIEIETKAGRHAHLVGTPGTSGIRLGAGPIEPPDEYTGRLSRQWRDLTDRVPAAFDGRPRIVAVTPAESLDDGGGEPIASAWWIILDTGVRLHCRSSGSRVEIDV